MYQQIFRQVDYEALRSIFKHDYDKAKELLDKNCILGHTPSMYALAGV